MILKVYLNRYKGDLYETEYCVGLFPYVVTGIANVAL